MQSQTAAVNDPLLTVKKDPLYGLSEKSISIEGSTSNRNVTIINATSNGSNTAQNGGLAGQLTEFQFSTSSSKKIRFDTSALEVEFQVTGPTYNTLPGMQENGVSFIQYAGIAWNFFAAMISELQFIINGTQILNIQGGKRYLAAMMDYLLSTFSYDELENKEYIIAPFNEDKQYLFKYQVDDTRGNQYYDLGNTLRRYTNHALSPEYSFVSAGNAIAEVPTVSSGANDAGKNTIFFAKRACVNNRVFQRNDEPLRSFFLRYVNCISKAADPNKKFVIRVPVRDLLLGLNLGICNNIRSIQLKIRWTSDRTVYFENVSKDYIGTGVNAPPNPISDYTINQNLFITQARILLDEYVPNVGTELTSLNDKLDQKSDKIAFIDRDARLVNWSGDDVLFTNIKNLDHIFLTQFSNDCYLATEDANNDKGATSGQFYLFNSECDNNNNVKANYRYNSQELVTTDKKSVLTNMSMFYGNVQYPNGKLLEVVKNNQLNTTELYYEYLKAIGKLNGGQPAVTYEMFKNVMPFIMLKPFTNNAVRLGSGDLTLRLDGSSSQLKPGNRNFHCVISAHKFIEILTDGTTRIKEF